MFKKLSKLEIWLFCKLGFYLPVQTSGVYMDVGNYSIQNHRKFNLTHKCFFNTLSSRIKFNKIVKRCEAIDREQKEFFEI